MEKIVAYMEKHVVPVATKIGSQRHLLAIRNGFLGMFALTMLSSLCVLVQNLPIAPYKEWLATSELGMHINSVCQNISWGTFSFMAIFACFGIAHSLWIGYGKKGVEGAFVATAVFLAVSPQTTAFKLPKLQSMIDATGANIPLDVEALFGAELLENTFSVGNVLSASNFGAGSLFTAIIIALLSVEVLKYFYDNEKLKIKLPDSVPPAVSKSFEALIPGMFTLVIMITAGYVFRQLCNGMFITEVIAKIVQAPLQGLTNSLGAAILIPFGNSLFWTLGLHGSQIMSPITSPLLTALSAENMALAAAGATTGYNTITSPFFFAYAWHGGSGATLGLLLAMVVAGKKSRERNKAITSLAMGPSVFNINEPVIFGVPIVLNPIYAIPFILAPVINSVIAYFAIEVGLVAPTIVQSVPWVTPPIIYGFLATGHWTGAALSAFTFVLSIVIYLPFVKASLIMEEKEAMKNQKLADANGNISPQVAATEETKEEIEIPVATDGSEMRIMLACAGGMSTSLLAKKMENFGKDKGHNVRVWAVGISSIPKESGNYDVLLLGPQVKHAYDKLRAEADADRPVEVIKSQDYGTMNAEAVYTRAMQLLATNN